METQIWCLPPGFVGGGLRKGAMVSVSIFVWQKAVPSPLGLAQMPDNSVSPCRFLKPLELLFQHWSSERVRGLVCTHVLSEELSRTLEAFCLTQPKLPLVFMARSYGHFSSWHGALGWGT